jgi:hypothetical protein
MKGFISNIYFFSAKFCQNAKNKNKKGIFCKNILTSENFAKFSKNNRNLFVTFGLRF